MTDRAATGRALVLEPWETPMHLDGFERIRFVGDEDGGVGLECLDHWDGGRPLAYLTHAGDMTYADDPKVEVVHHVAALLLAGRRHLDMLHVGWPSR